MSEEVLYGVFLDLKKVENILDWHRNMEILVAYGVGPWKERLLRKYWEGLTIVARAWRYYGAPFKGSRGVMQVDRLSPTIFNMLVDVFICHLAAVVSGENASLEGSGRLVENLATRFYTDNVLLASPRSARLQESLEILAGLFERVGLWANV